MSTVDHAAGRLFAGFFDEHFPGVALESEETRGAWPPDVEDVWIIDPLDGTHNYLAGVPLCGAMATFISNGTVMFSAIILPGERAFGRSGLYVAGRGFGSWEWHGDRPPTRLAVSTEVDLQKAFLLLEGPSAGLLASPAAQTLMRISRRWRVNLGACVSGAVIAQGGIVPRGADILITVENKPFDNLPIALLVEEAGGRVTDYGGRAWSVENYANLVLSNAVIHEAALARTKP